MFYEIIKGPNKNFDENINFVKPIINPQCILFYIIFNIRAVYFK